MYGSKLNDRTRSKMKKLLDFIDATIQQLTKKNAEFDLEDVNSMMKTMNQLREMEAKIHLKLAPVQDAYNMLNKFACRVKVEEQEMLEKLENKWDVLVKQSSKSMGMYDIDPRMFTVM